MGEKKLQDKLAKVTEMTEKKKYLEQKRTNDAFVKENSTAGKSVVVTEQEILKGKYEYENTKGTFVKALKKFKIGSEERKVKKNNKKLTQLNDKIFRLNKDLESLDNTIMDKVSEIEIQERDMLVCYQQVKEIESKIIAAKKEIQLKTNAFNTNEKEIKTLERNKLDLMGELEAIQAELGRKEKGNQWQGELLQELLAEKETLIESIKKVEEEVASKVKEEKEINGEIEELKANISDLRKNEVKVSTELDMTSINYQNTRVTAEKLENELKALESEIFQNEEKINKNKNNITDLNLKISRAENEINSTKNRKFDLKTKMEELEQEIEERKIEQTTLEIELRDERFALESLQDSEARLKTTLANFKEEEERFKELSEKNHSDIKHLEVVVREIQVEIEQCHLNLNKLDKVKKQLGAKKEVLEEEQHHKTQELKKLTNRLKLKEAKKAELEEQIKNSESRKSELEIEKEEIIQSIGKINEANENNTHALNNMVEVNTKLTEENVELSAVFEQKKEEFAKSERNITKIENQNRELDKVISALKNELETVVSKVEECNRTIHGNEILKTNCQKKVSELKEKIKYAGNEKNTLITRIEEMKEEVFNLEQEIAAKTLELEALSHEAIDLQNEINTQAIFKQQLVEKRNDCENTTKNLEKEISRLKGKKRESEEINASLQNTINELKHKEQNLCNEVQTVEQSIAIAEKKHEEQSIALRGKETSLESLKTERTDLLNQLLKLENKIIAQDNAMTELHTAMGAVKGELNEAREEKSRKLNQLDRGNEEVKKTTFKLYEVKRNIDEVNKDVDHCQKQIDIVDSKYNELQNTVHENRMLLKELREKNQNMKNEKHELEQKLNAVEVDTVQLQTTIHHLANSINTVNDEIVSKKDAFKALVDENRSKKELVLELNDNLSQLQLTSEDYSEKLKKANFERDMLTNDVNVSTDMVAKKRIEVEETSNMFKSVKTEISLLKEANTALEVEIQEQNSLSKAHELEESQYELKQLQIKNQSLNDKLIEAKDKKAEEVSTFQDNRNKLKELSAIVKEKELAIQRLNKSLSHLALESKQLYRDRENLNSKMSLLTKREEYLSSSLAKRKEIVDKSRARIQGSREIDVLMATATDDEEVVLDRIMDEAEPMKAESKEADLPELPKELRKGKGEPTPGA